MGRQVGGSRFKDDAFAVEVFLEFAEDEFPCVVHAKDFERETFLSNKETVEILEGCDRLVSTRKEIKKREPGAEIGK